jgi:competence protein ComEC
MILILLGALASLVAGVIFLAPFSPLRHRPPPPDWILAMCDVGQGDGLALAAGPGAAVVVDTGPDPGKMDDCLAGLGVRRIPLLVLTHFHADHIDGVPGVLAGRRVGEIETTTLDDPAAGAAKVRQWADAAHIRVTRAGAGEHRAFGPLSWDVLWPTAGRGADESAGDGAGDGAGGAASAGLTSTDPGPDRSGRHASRRRRSGSSRSSHSGEEGSAPNNASVVLRVRVATRDGPVTLLLTGDIEPPAQQAVLAAHPDLRADIFKVPHHGSKYQDPDLIRAVRPRLSLISVGAGNDYGHPAPDTVRLAGSTGAAVLRTDRDGEIVVYGSAGRLRVQRRG